MRPGIDPRLGLCVLFVAVPAIMAVYLKAGASTSNAVFISIVVAVPLLVSVPTIFVPTSSYKRFVFVLLPGLLMSLATCWAWGPGFREFAGRPIVGFFWVAAAVFVLGLFLSCVGACLGYRVPRKTLAGCCMTCGYSLTGLAKDAACPECGSNTT